ncbi:MAG: ferredoxin reductase [Terracoccus sp.]
MPRIRWQRARLVDTRRETRRARTLVFEAPEWAGHDAGQHVDLKLTADDGFSAQRSYSIASASDPGRLELTVQAVSGGVVSPYLVDTMAVGDELELRGPIGGWFRWTEQLLDPVLLVGGGSGIAPLMAMLRQRAQVGSSAPFHLVYSARTPDHVFYANELYSISQDASGATVDLLYTRSGLPDDARPAGRLSPDDLPAAVPGEGSTRVYVCGPNGFVENAARLLLDRGHPPASIRTERFGSSGG